MDPHSQGRETSLEVGAEGARFLWHEDWARLPPSGWAHHGLAVTAAGTIIAAHPGEATLLELAHDGTLLRSARTGLTECHGISVHKDAGAEVFWIADIGKKRDPARSYESNVTGAPQVVKMSRSFEILTRLDPPSHPAYKEARYAPTSAVAAPSTGDVWVADGYGASLVHRYCAGGALRATLSGEEGAGRFHCPHTVWLDTRRGEPELYIADRGNGRVQVYDLEGGYKRSVRNGALQAPTGFAAYGDLLLVIDLNAALAVLDRDDALVCVIGEDREVVALPGWPNELDGAGHPARPRRLRPGRFNSPHAVAADRSGNVYVAEWLIGGRITRLAPFSAHPASAVVAWK